MPDGDDDDDDCRFKVTFDDDVPSRTALDRRSDMVHTNLKIIERRITFIFFERKKITQQGIKLLRS